MKQVQKTTWAGGAGLAVSIAMMRTYFQDVPVNEVFETIRTLDVAQVLDIVVPLLLGTLGIAFDEEKLTKKE